MNICYIILAHKAPKQVARLIKKLSSAQSCFYIHIDQEVDIFPFQREVLHIPNVFFLPSEMRQSVLWADFGMVQATLNCIKLINAYHQNGYCVLLSGQDYPIKSNGYIDHFLKSHYGLNFIQGYPITPFIPADEGAIRINSYKINLSEIRNDILTFPSVYDRTFYQKKTIQSFLTLVQRKSIAALFQVLLKALRKRKFPSYLHPYKGSQWWALPMETLRLIDKFITDHPGYLDYHLYTFAPDEIFFHSIIFSLIERKHISDDITYVEWPDNKGGPSLLQEADFNRVISQGNNKLFARKFDIEIDDKILDLIDIETCDTIRKVITDPLDSQY